MKAIKNKVRAKKSKKSSKNNPGNSSLNTRAVYSSIKNSSEVIVTTFKGAINKSNGKYLDKY